MSLNCPCFCVYVMYWMLFRFVTLTVVHQCTPPTSWLFDTSDESHWSMVNRQGSRETCPQQTDRVDEP